MYRCGDVVVYCTTGICKVEKVGCVDISCSMQDKEYYTLQPLSESHRETICVPTDTKAFMRLIINKAEAEKYIKSIKDIQRVEPQSKNPRAAADFYSSLIGSYDVNNLLTVIVSLIKKRRDCEEKGKKLNRTQFNFLRKAQELVYSEFAVAMSVSVEEIGQIIESQI